MLHRLGRRDDLAAALLRAGRVDEAVALARDERRKPTPYALVAGALKAPGDAGPPLLAALRASRAWHGDGGADALGHLAPDLDPALAARVAAVVGGEIG